MGEVELAAMLCWLLGGADTEVRTKFENLGTQREIRVDCETPTHVIEVGLDRKRSARDSVHQAVFASILTGKAPMVVLIDTDGVEDRYEQEVRMVTKHLGIAYHFCREDFLVRWLSLQPLRNAASDAVNDLPTGAVAAVQCNLEFPDIGRKLDPLPIDTVIKD